MESQDSLGWKGFLKVEPPLQGASCNQLRLLRAPSNNSNFKLDLEVSIP